MGPRISVIMNCYNGEKYLREAIESVLAQTYSNWEIIFWDNQSTDGSAQVVRSFNDPRIRYFYAPRHTSLGEARNLAAKQANGAWLAFLDCDDLWMPLKLESQVKRIGESKDDTALIYCKALIMGGKFDGCELARGYSHRPLPEGRILRDYLSNENFIPLLSALVKAPTFWEVGGIPSEYKQAEDFYIFAAIASKYPVRAVQEVLCKYRVHEGNLTNKQKLLNYSESLLVIEKFWPSLGSKCEEEAQKEKILKKHKAMKAILQVKTRDTLFAGIVGLLQNPFLSLRLVLEYVFSNKRNFQHAEISSNPIASK